MPPRAQRYVSPQLAQCVTVTPNAAYAVVRLSKGYNGPTVKVRRASDSTTKDCLSQADISAFCAGTNGFIATWYDQAGTGRDQTQATAGSQVKVFDSATGIIFVDTGRSTPALAADGTDDSLGIAGSSLGFLSAPAMTTAILTKFDDAGVTSTHSGAFQVGGANDATPNAWQWQMRPDLSQVVPRWIGVVERFTPSPSVTTLQYLVAQIALNANGNTLTVRANKTALTNATPGSGTPAIAAGLSRIFCNNLNTLTDNNFYLGRIAVLAFYAANLATSDRDALEQALECLRVQ